MASAFSVSGQNPVNYSPAYFGPHALPVPDVSNGKIPGQTLLGLSMDYSFGYGDRTAGWRLDAEFPLIPEHVSFKLWFDLYEAYSLTPAINGLRGIAPQIDRGHGVGDAYVQTRISVLSERKLRPQMIVSATIKTASGGNFDKRRFYDTPGYYFDLSVAKSLPVRSGILKDVRLVADLGFLCWETTGSKQNDAPMYGLNLIFSNSRLSLENQLAGYCGWIHNGDRPLVYRTRLTCNYKSADLFFQYQWGIVDFPYHQVRFGVLVSIARLTPKYNSKISE